MKIKYKLFNLTASFLMILIMTSCASVKNPDLEESQNPEVVSNAKCEIKECIKQIKTSNSIEEINEIIGFEGEQNEYSKKYIWHLTDKTFIEATPSTDEQFSINANHDKESLIDEKIDFSEYNNIKKYLESGKSFTYKQMTEKLGGEGTLAGKTPSSKRYIWVNKNKQTFSATFNDKTKKCTIISLK